MTDQPAPLRLRLPYASEDEFVTKLGPSLVRGSMFCATKSPKPEGAVFGFEFVLSDGRKVLSGEAKVTSLSKDPAKPGMTLAFRRMEPSAQELMQRPRGASGAPPGPPPPAARPSTPPAQRRVSLPESPAPDPLAEERRRRLTTTIRAL